MMYVKTPKNNKIDGNDDLMAMLSRVGKKVQKTKNECQKMVCNEFQSSQKT